MNNNVDRSFYAFNKTTKTLVHGTTYFIERELLNGEGKTYLDCAQGGSFFMCVKDGILQQGKATTFETIDDAEAFIATALDGFEEISADAAETMMMTAELPPLPPLPAGMVPGTFAHTAWSMVQDGTMTGEEADRWKDEMKEAY